VSLAMSALLREKVLQLLASVTETDEVRTNFDLSLYDNQLLDSIRTVELMVGIEEEFGLKISPAEFERENWSTPRKIIADLERRGLIRRGKGRLPKSFWDQAPVRISGGSLVRELIEERRTGW